MKSYQSQIFSNTAMIEVIRANPLPRFRIQIELSNGGKCILDLFDLVDQPKGPMALPLRDEDFFNQVIIKNGTVTWPNGFDLCPDVISQRLKS